MDKAQLYLMMIWFDKGHKHYVTRATAGPLSQAVESTAPYHRTPTRQKDYETPIDYLNYLLNLLYVMNGLKQKIFITHFQKRPHTWTTERIYDA